MKSPFAPFVARISSWARDMAAAAPGTSQASINRHLLSGGVIVLLLAGGVGGWAVMALLSSALIAEGSIVVDSNVKKVQHPTGGTVGKSLARAGDHVNAGDILVQLDERVMRANLAIATKPLDYLATPNAR